MRNSNPDPSSKTSVHTHMQQNLLMKRNKSATIAVLSTTNDERQMQLKKVQSDDKTQFRVKLDHLANRYVLKKDKLGPTLGVRQSPKIREIQTLQHSRKDPSIGPRAWTNIQEHQLRHCTTTCTKFQVRILRIDIGSSNRFQRAMFLHLL